MFLTGKVWFGWMWHTANNIALCPLPRWTLKVAVSNIIFYLLDTLACGSRYGSVGAVKQGE